jgi:hypothetical protein
VTIKAQSFGGDGTFLYLCFGGSHKAAFIKMNRLVHGKG